MAVQSPTSRKAHGEIFPLGVSSWPLGDVPHGPFLHRVVVGLGDLRVFSKLEAAVLGVFGGDPSDYMA